MKIIPAVSDEDEWPIASAHLLYQPPKSNMSKPLAALVIVALFPLFLPVAAVWLLVIAAARIVEWWYQALEELKH